VGFALAALVLGCHSSSSAPAPKHIVLEYDPTTGVSIAHPDTNQRIQDALMSRLRHMSSGSTVRLSGPASFTVDVPPSEEVDRVSGALTKQIDLEWYDAKTVSTGNGEPRTYDVGDLTKYKGGQAYNLSRRGQTTPIAPGTKEYAEAIKSWGKPLMTASDIAQADPQPHGDSYVPALRFTAQGAKTIEAWSRRYMNAGEQVAIVINDVIVSIAPLKPGTILRDSAIVDGAFDKNYVFELVDSLNMANIPVHLTVKAGT